MCYWHISVNSLLDTHTMCANIVKSQHNIHQYNKILYSAQDVCEHLALLKELFLSSILGRN